MYCYINGVDDELWDIIEYDITFSVDTNGTVTNMKNLSATKFSQNMCFNRQFYHPLILFTQFR